MRVTDEVAIVQEIRKDMRTDPRMYFDVIIRNLDRLEAALSHAAGQEAVAPFAWAYTFPYDGETDHCLSMARFLPSWVEVKGATEHPLYLAHANPSTSAEVGRDASRFQQVLRDQWLRHSKYGDQVMGWEEAFLARIDAAIASSGRKGG